MNLKYKKCLNCGDLFTNIRKSNSNLLGEIQFSKMKFCSYWCMGMSRFKSNKFTFNKDKCFIHIGDKKIVLDKNEFSKIKSYTWYIDSVNYVASHPRKGLHSSNKSMIRLHNLIMGNKTGFVIDHINGNKLDNRKSNLRHIKSNKNVFNAKRKSKHVGVSYRKNENKYYAYIECNKNKIRLGSSKNLNEAIELRKMAELKYFGELSPCYRSVV